MSLSIKYANDLRRDLDEYRKTLDLVKGNTGGVQPINGITSPGGGTGVSAAAVKDAKATDVFSAAAKHGGNNATASQNNSTQTNMSNATAYFNEFFANVKNNTINLLVNIINSLEAQENTLKADSSPIEAPRTSGQTVKPQDNVPADNQGTKNNAANPNDSQKPNVGFGEETTENNPKTEGSKESEKTKETKEKDKTEEQKEPEKAEREESTQQAQTSSELDKAAQKEYQKQREEAQEKINQEAARLAREMGKQA